MSFGRWFKPRNEDKRRKSPLDPHGDISVTRATGDELATAGVPMEKAWLTADNGGERPLRPRQPPVCTVCARNGQQGWVPLAEAFVSGHQQPLAHEDCRCDLLMRAVGTESAMDIKIRLAKEDR